MGRVWNMLSVHNHMKKDILEPVVRKARSRDLLASVIWLPSSDDSAAGMKTVYFQGY